MKKLINDVEKVVAESLSGLAKAHADMVKLHPSVRAVLRAVSYTHLDVYKRQALEYD